MKREKLKQLYEVTWERDEKNGRPRRRTRYVGKRYALDLEARNRLRPPLAAAAALGVAAFLAGGLINSQGSHCLWVLPFYALCALPLFYFALAVARIARLKAEIDEIALEESLGSARRSAGGLAALGALWTAADAVFLLGTGPAPLGQELLFLACGAACAAAGGLALRLLRGLTPREIPR